MKTKLNTNMEYVNYLYKSSVTSKAIEEEHKNMKNVIQTSSIWDLSGLLVALLFDYCSNI